MMKVNIDVFKEHKEINKNDTKLLVRKICIYVPNYSVVNFYFYALYSGLESKNV